MQEVNFYSSKKPEQCAVQSKTRASVEVRPTLSPLRQGDRKSECEQYTLYTCSALVEYAQINDAYAVCSAAFYCHVQSSETAVSINGCVFQLLSVLNLSGKHKLNINFLAATRVKMADQSKSSSESRPKTIAKTNEVRVSGINERSSR